MAGHGAVAPSEYPPPVDPPGEFVKRALDPPDERIEVGVVIVGGGTGRPGLRQPAAAAARGRAGAEGAPRRGAGRGDREGQGLRGAQPLGRRDAARVRCTSCSPTLIREDWPEGATARSPGEAVYSWPKPGGDPAAAGAAELPQPRQPRRVGRRALPVDGRPGGGGRRLRPDRDVGRPSCSWTDGAVVGVRSGDKGRGSDGEPLRNFEPGSDVTAQATVLAEGVLGPPDGAAIKRFALAEYSEPQVWSLGVKEVWEVAKPLDRVIHTLGLAAAPADEVPRVRRVVDLPDGRATRSRSASSPASTTPTRPSRSTTCSRSSSSTRWCGGSSTAASASPGARRRSPRAATGRCRG